LGVGGTSAKIYWSNPTSGQELKLIRLFDIGRELDQDERVGRLATLPLAPAFDETSKGLVGFSMRFLEDFIPLSYLKYDQNLHMYQASHGFQFTDNTAIEAVKKMFAVLDSLAKRHIAVGDISMQNILVDPKTGMPGFVDMDSVHLEGFISSSMGTVGYTDPHLLEMDLNTAGGLHFDQSTDIFALSVVAYALLVGIMPHQMATIPPLASLDDYVKKGISHIRVLREGFRFLAREGLQLVDRTYVDYVKNRLEELQTIRGSSGQDGALLIQYFEDVFVGGRRDNLVDRFGGDEWDSIEPVLIRTGGRRAIDELADRFNIPDPRIAKKHRLIKALEVPRGPRRNVPFVARDPLSLSAFAAVRGIDLETLIS
jgi:serine/threonine protein kinase